MHETGTRTCNVCGEIKPLTEYYRYSKNGQQGAHMRRCKKCHGKANTAARQRHGVDVLNARQREYNARRPASQKLANRMRYRYGLTPDDWQALLAAQDHRCAICRTHVDDLPEDGRHVKLYVDHCHDTGRVRGLCCNACNRGMGSFRDDPKALRAAAAYIESRGVPLATQNEWVAQAFLN